MADITAEKIYEVLGRQEFADWYGDQSDDDNSDFGNHIRGLIPSKEQILADIKRLFGLVD